MKLTVVGIGMSTPTVEIDVDDIASTGEEKFYVDSRTYTTIVKMRGRRPAITAIGKKADIDAEIAKERAAKRNPSQS